MGKHKRQRSVASRNSSGPYSKAKPHHPQSKLKSPASKPNSTPQKIQKAQQQQTAPTIPFQPEDRILLIGEGDLSFARSLLEHHGCTALTATVLEKDRTTLEEKYPHVGQNIAAIEEYGGSVKYGVDAMRLGVVGLEKRKGDGGERIGGMDRIIFNFPHVGGKSTDVNRQVRYNQELLVAFFMSAMPSLAPGGTIIVTLFEGEPYTLWNIRDLARHSGLQVERSFRFQASIYPGYHHARTLGVVRSKRGETGVGWKGEDRPARSYIFIRKGDQPVQIPSKKPKDDESSDEDD